MVRRPTVTPFSNPPKDGLRGEAALELLASEPGKVVLALDTGDLVTEVEVAVVVVLGIEGNERLVDEFETLQNCWARSSAEEISEGQSPEMQLTNDSGNR